jgi:hypothetical protein
MSKAKRDVYGFIDASIEDERGNSTAAPPGGYARGLNKAEADLVYETVRRTLAAVGLPTKPEWSAPNEYQAGRLDNAYVQGGLDPKPWSSDTRDVPHGSGVHKRCPWLSPWAVRKP